MITIQQKVSKRIKKANQITLVTDYLRQAARGSDNGHLLSDFQDQQPVNPWVEGLLTFVGVAAFIWVIWACWFVFSKTQGGA